MAQSSEYARIAYRRAARSVLGQELPLPDLLATMRPRDLPSVGPSSERVILEHLEHGTSPTVAAAIERSGQGDAVEAARALRAGFLSRAAVNQVLRSPAPGTVGLEDYRGDLQMHSTWSDGADSPRAMADAAIAKGHEYLAITDHSYGLPIAGGMSMAAAGRQRAEIERVNHELGGRFRVLQGIEANIGADGSVDLEPGEMAEFELVVASPHSRLRRPEDQTERMLAAVRHPGVHVLGHPRGRMYTRRGVLARWDEVFAEAARLEVAIEIDGDPWRQDVDWSLARSALAAGCWFALDSDAHAPAQLAYSEYAIAHARLAGIPAGRVVNCWPLDRLLEWAAARAARASS